jgi:hypothetical protein
MPVCTTLVAAECRVRPSEYQAALRSAQEI